MRSPMLLASTVLALCCSLARAQARSSYAGTHHFEDAEAYLTSVGVIEGLPHLEVKYTSSAWGQKLEVLGSDTALSLTEVKGAPQVKWDPQNDPNGHANKFVLLMIGPDEPRRNGPEGREPGANGPYIYWMGLNCLDSAESCYQAIPYEAPNPEPGTGSHRYIFLLFRQTAQPPSMDVLGSFLNVGTRQRWDLRGFVREMAKSMAPAALNFFYSSVEGTGQTGGGGGGGGGQQQPQQPQVRRMKRPEEVPKAHGSSLGPSWDPKARPVHEEL
jgi:phosphatidylethanolamine-binding protein (PEBP) family uncharacterized protein